MSLPLLLKRRAFISTVFKATAATALLPIAGTVMAKPVRKEYTVNDVMQLILKEIPGAPFADTVDTLKSGTVSQKVTGIVTTMFATVDVIQQAIKSNANFIIAHEPTFFNHNDDKNWVEKNDVLKKKEQLLETHGIAVWRFHDYWHAHRPDGIRYGVANRAGWEKYHQTDEEVMYKLPSQTLQQIAVHLKSSLGIEHLRLIGNLSQRCERIALLPGAAGGQAQISIIEKYQPDVLIVGEVHEWETAEYVRDAQALGEKTALIVLGHSQSEEPGMQWLAEWLQPKVEGIKVKPVLSGNPFKWL